MLKKDIVNGLKQTLSDGSLGYAIHWPNVDSAEDRPYLTFMASFSDREDPTLKGGNSVLRETGFVTIVVVADKNGGEDTANDIADSVKDLFVPGTRIAITDGEITIMTAPEIRSGFPQGSEWRVPVVFNYMARSTA